MKKIERPDWRCFPNDASLAEWFNENVEPINKMLSEGVEVNCIQSNDNVWYYRDNINNLHSVTQKAFLINIEPIKKENAKDVLRDYIRAYDGEVMDCGEIELYNRARKVLED